MPDLLTPRLADAVSYTVQLFGRDARKQSTVPVLAHLFAVCGLVVHDGGDEDEAIAALLHDALEDKPLETSPAEIAKRFGERVLALIQTATDTPPDYRGGRKPSWKERKERYLQHVEQSPPRDLRVALADKVDNVRAMLADYRRHGEAFWNRFNAGKEDQLWYYRRALASYRAAGVQSHLLDELALLVDHLAEAAA